SSATRAGARRNGSTYRSSKHEAQNHNYGRCPEFSMNVKKLGTFGAEAANIKAPFREIWDAFFAAQGLVFRGQELAANEYLTFARQFGRPEPHVIDQFHHPEHADILILSNVQKNGQPIGLADAGTYFHTDYSYLDIPARATLLYSIEVPKKGGDTL